MDYPNDLIAKFAKFVLSIGLFGFSGGITNWLAVKMLFDEIPGIYGSGVIPKRFKEIRETVKIIYMLLLTTLVAVYKL